MRAIPYGLMPTHAALAGLVVLSFGMANGGEEPGAVELAKEGLPTAAIVSNGFDKQAKNLQEYLKQITGAALPIVKAGSDAASVGKCAIVLQMVKEIPGASSRETAKQAYRVHTEAGNLLISAVTDLGLTDFGSGLQNIVGALGVQP